MATQEAKLFGNVYYNSIKDIMALFIFGTDLRAA
jgi:hypothetical protein